MSNFPLKWKIDTQSWDIIRNVENETKELRRKKNAGKSGANVPWILNNNKWNTARRSIKRIQTKFIQLACLSQRNRGKFLHFYFYRFCYFGIDVIQSCSKCRIAVSMGYGFDRLYLDAIKGVVCRFLKINQCKRGGNLHVCENSHLNDDDTYKISNLRQPWCWCCQCNRARFKSMDTDFGYTCLLPSTG